MQSHIVSEVICAPISVPAAVGYSDPVSFVDTAVTSFACKRSHQVIEWVYQKAFSCCYPHTAKWRRFRISLRYQLNIADIVIIVLVPLFGCIQRCSLRHAMVCRLQEATRQWIRRLF